VTLRTLLTGALPRLHAAGVESPQLDAELLLAHLLGRSRTYLYAHLGDEAPAEAAADFEALLTRRAAREPLPYLLGEWEFMRLRLKVAPGVLIPRPETEILVEQAAARLPSRARVLDVGTGSGCIALGVAALLLQAQVTALEASPAAVAIARENVLRAGAGERVTVVEGRFPEAARALGVFDGVVSNPPYIPSAEIDGLAPEVRDHEPCLALDGGADGLDVVRTLIEEAPRLLRPGGVLAIEVGSGQVPRVQDLLRAAGGWEDVEAAVDLAGIDRVVLARRGDSATLY
jgi:release factor glutamine methyltransferase